MSCAKNNQRPRRPPTAAAEPGHVVAVGAFEAACHERLDRMVVGNSPAMRALKEMICLAAECQLTTLVTGESGTGKELVAQTIHELGARSGGPFVPVNCAALPEALLEAELFGHERGAFTGAQGRKDGLFVAADGGTIFLDEAGEMSALMQSKLLRVLQERMVRPVGAHRERRFDARVIVATNKDLEREVGEGRMREDLYYRLNVLPVHLPPLRERRADIPRLAEGFLRRLPASGAAPEIEAAALLLLCQHTWPGNVRELQNVVERAWLLAGKGQVITVAHVGAALLRHSPATRPHPAGPPASWSRRDGRGVAGFDAAKLGMIEAALTLSGGNQARAARMLGMKRAAFHRLRKRVAARAAGGGGRPAPNQNR